MICENVWTNGCFDVLHMGHIKLLNFAKSLGKTLTVGIDSDQRIKNNKSPDRPINTADERAEFLYNLKCVDKVVIFDSDIELENYLRDLNIETMVIGDDYIDKAIVGQELVKRIIFFPKIANKSSSLIINKL